MYKTVKTISILALLVLTFVSVGPAFAEDDAPPEGEGVRPLREYVVAAFAEALGLDPADVQSRLDAGEKLGEIAAEQGIEGDDFKTLMSEVADAALAQAVRDGAITQERADRIGSRYQNRVDRREWLRRIGERILDRLGVTRQELAEMLRSGMTLAEIAESLDVDLGHPVVRDRILDRLGLSREEIRTRLEAGETIREILESEGLELPNLGDRARRNRQ